MTEPSHATGGHLLPDPIYHLALPDDWAEAVAAGRYTVSTRGSTLDAVGFIHCSTASQIGGVFDRFYRDVADLLVLTIDPRRLDADVRYEPPAPGIDECFPHVYGPIPIEAVVDVAPFDGGRPPGR
jgi:glutathione S-transferase